MTSIREQIIAGIVARLEAADLGGNVGVYRSRTAALSRKDSVAAVVVSPVGDVPQQTTVPKLDWDLSIHAIVYTRGDEADVLADPIITAVHAVIMDDQSQGNLAMDTQPGGVNFGFSDGDESICFATLQFDLKYRTDQRDLTTQ
jgi:hypothetical protein